MPSPEDVKKLQEYFQHKPAHTYLKVRLFNAIRQARPPNQSASSQLAWLLALVVVARFLCTARAFCALTESFLLLFRGRSP